MPSAATIRVGTAGWSYKDWDGILYPPEVTRKKIHPVEYLARFFDVIEINTSFYGHIRPEIGRQPMLHVAPLRGTLVLISDVGPSGHFVR